MSRWISIIGLFVLALNASGCSSDAGGCTEGESAKCFCPDGEGAQTCTSEGTFTACDCGANNENSTPNNATPNNANNVAPNNVTPNNVTPNNMTPNNVTPNNVTPNNVTPNNNPSGPGFCKQTCNVGPDCAVFGDPSVWDCNDNLCDLKACTTDEGCVRQMSNWSAGCNSSGQCGTGFECATIQGVNYCAFAPIPGFFECGQLQLDEITAISADSGQPTTVCAAPDALCDQPSGFCFRPCATDTDCRPEGQTVGLACLPNGQCGCTENAHCTIAGDLCIDGECMCSDQQVCDVITSMSGVPFVCSP